jgi:hypothetical protein
VPGVERVPRHDADHGGDEGGVRKNRGDRGGRKHTFSSDLSVSAAFLDVSDEPIAPFED